MVPFQREKWSAHWMAVTVEIHGHSVLVVNCYAPSDTTAREAYFESLLDVANSHDGPLFVGGDFNCTLYPRADQSNHGASSVHGSHALRRFLEEWDLEDVLGDDADEALDTRALEQFYAKHHTYFYTLENGCSASSRLDRWYCNPAHTTWIRAIDASVSGPFSDHDGVTLRLATPSHVIQTRRPRKMYPTPEYAARQAAHVSATFFEAAQVMLDSQTGDSSDPYTQAKASAKWWDEAKTKLKKDYLDAKRDAAAKIKNSHVQKLRRLLAQLANIYRSTESPDDPAESGSSQDAAQPRTAADFRHRISECKLSWQEIKAQRLRKNHSQSSSKAFFQRFSTKFLDNTIHSLGPSTRHGPNKSVDLANDMADRWIRTKQQAAATAADIDDFFGTLPPSDVVPLMQEIMQPFTETEVRAAIVRSKRGRAHGPDEIGNDWYREHVEQLTPLLTRLFNDWLHAGVLPPSFGEANIHCLKKSATSATPLEHRPIALLNSDYKVFTRIFATRMRPLLPWIIHHLQAGFVPNRSIHTVIDTLLAAQAEAATEEELAAAIALLLDFQKAYDSLDRGFLLRALQFLGFPDSFVNIVQVLHGTTSCRFLVNGYQSRKIAVTCGIRQGCPLAPLLFILALDVLYRKVEATDEIKGVTLARGGSEAMVKLSGYADDTAIYLHSAASIPATLRVLAEFGRVSGLVVNLKESIVLPLAPDYRGSTEDGDAGIPWLKPSEHCRYLGIMVGRTEAHDANWTKCIGSFRGRLHLARLKTHTVAQRAVAACAIIVPKILFVARHSWPNKATVDALQQLTKSSIWGIRDGKTSRAWLSEEQAELSTRHGGLAIPNILAEAHALSAAVVSHWATNSSRFERLIGDILLGAPKHKPLYITPAGTEPTKSFKHGSSLWRTGVEVVRATHAASPYDGYAAEIRSCAARFKSRHTSSSWNGRVWHVNAQASLGPWLSNMLLSRKGKVGQTCTEWLPYAAVADTGWLLDDKGYPLTIPRSWQTTPGTVLRDLVTWCWTGHGTLAFTMTGCAEPSGPRRRSFETLCMAILCNFPQIILRPPPPAMLRPYDAQVQQHHEWRLLAGLPIQLEHYDTAMLASTRAIGRSSDADSMARADTKRATLEFHAHPEHCRLVQIWGDTTRWRTKRKTYKQRITHKRKHVGTASRDAGVARTKTTETSILNSVADLEWRDIFRLPLWNHRAGNLSCPHTECDNQRPATIQHTFWECPALDDDLIEHLHPMASTAWRYMAAATIHGIWRMRLLSMNEDPVSEYAMRAATNTHLRHGILNLVKHVSGREGPQAHQEAVVLRRLVQALLAPAPPPLEDVRSTRGCYLLFFNGGSRGNPGPGGSGSVIARMEVATHQAAIIWVACMAYTNPATTNNTAEYWGLLHGLRVARAQRLGPLHVVGDSAMIIRQQRLHRQPKNTKLAHMYKATKKEADRLDVRSWTHHYRNRNKMADHAANVAMDGKRSMQMRAPTSRPEMQQIRDLLDNDVLHWIENTAQRSAAAPWDDCWQDHLST